MDFKPPFTDVDINLSRGGFYKGYSVPIALLSKLGMALLVVWAAMRPEQAKEILSSVNGMLLNNFNAFYIIAVGIFMVFCFVIAIIPASGKRLLGKPGERPEFSTFSWFAMMFGAGLGVGLMVYATAEPMGLWGSNPEIVKGAVTANTAEAIESAYRYTFLHYGFHAWAIYVVTGLSMAYYAFRRDMPLTIRSALTPVLGRWANGFLGHLVDILGVVATVLGIAVTIGFGVSQLVDGVYSISGLEWLMQPGAEGGPAKPSTVGLISALLVIMLLSTISAVSGVGKGVKYLSNLNLVLSIVLIGAFLIFGSVGFAAKIYGTAFLDYLKNLPQLSFVAYPVDTEVGGWQKGWTTFYWAWWIAFAPFVGLFLARISRGRTIREFVLGAVIAPSLVCFLWMTALGGTAIDLELSGVAGGKIIEASTTNKLFATMGFMFEGEVLFGLTVMCVVLIMTFLVTSADSGVLVLNTIMAGGSIDTSIGHRIIWGILMTLVIGTLLVAGGGGLSALQNAMIIGALPFTMVMVLMCISLAKALLRDDVRDGHLSERQLAERLAQQELRSEPDYNSGTIQYRPLTRD
ncbi:MAG: BCCT family transporter [Thiolinea sp.]